LSSRFKRAVGAGGEWEIEELARIAGVDLPREKQAEFALTAIYGIGRTSARRILETVGIPYDRKVGEFTNTDLQHIREVLDRDFVIEGDLKRERQMNIRRLVEIGSYRGLRHRRGLPVRGQRTSTNARTRKGPRRTVGAKKKVKK
jgi:small subunit ribosomal protein S13